MCGELPRVAHERLLYFTPAQIDAAPQKCVGAILAAAAQLGGRMDTYITVPSHPGDTHLGFGFQDIEAELVYCQFKQATGLGLM